MNSQEQIIAEISKLDEITVKFDDVIKAESDLARQECALLSAEQIKSELERQSDENRLLNIGIIGRVKAGKSSLLNSVFFNGESVLPKAATPMTASLTVMTYGDTFSATVEYYSVKDIDDIKRLHDEYQNLLQPKIDEHKKKIEERAKKRNEPLDSKVEEKAERLAKNDIADERRSSAFDQYKKMVQSGKLEANRSGKETIAANNQSELIGKLNNYVGSSGALMPFTRSAEIYLPMDALRDIQVIDTPGINDPVASRTERTNEYLSKCDVVFIVSPSGQFISKDDVDLMDRLFSKEGVRELYFVGSQVDNQLYGSPGEESGWNLPNALESIRSELSAHAVQTLEALKQTNPEVEDLFDQLVKDSKERIIVTSALCHAMNLRFSDRSSWDADMNHGYTQLSEKYPDYFGSGDAARASLTKLSGVGVVKEKIELARSKKDNILMQKQKDYLAGQAKNVDEFRERLKSDVAQKIERLNNTDLKTVQDQIKKTKQISAKITEAIDGTFEDCVDDLKTDLRNAITEKGKVLFEETKGKVNDEEKSVTKTRTRTKGHLFWKKYYSENYEVTAVRAGAVKNNLSSLLDDLQDNLINSVETTKKDWKKSVQQRITRALTEAVEGDVDLIDFDMLKKALRRLVGNLELPNFDMSSYGFTGSQTGTLEGSDAERFISEVLEYQGKLRTNYNKETSNFIAALEKSAKREKMSGLIISDLSAQLETLEKELTNKNLILDRLNKCKTELGKMS